MRTPGALLALAGVLVACQPSQTDQAGATAAASHGPGATAPPAGGGTQGDAATDATAPHPRAGTWQGDYQAARRTISVPAGVPYAWWDEDQGAEAVGKGTVRLDVTSLGEVSGQSEGALGPLSIRGVFEGDELSAGLVPRGEDDQGMAGVLVGAVVGNVIEAELRVSSHDAKLVRLAPVRLERRP
jgi:hypothetical protein